MSPFPAADAARRVIDAFEGLIGDPASPRRPIEHQPPKMPSPPPRGAGLVTRTAPVHQPELWVAWPVPGTYAGIEPQTLARLSRSSWLGADSLVTCGRGSSGNLADIVETEARWAKRVSFSGPTFDLAKPFARRITETAARDPLVRIRRALHERLFPGHPYGASLTAEAIEALSSRKASQWLDGNVRPERGTLLGVSDVAPSPEGWRWIEEEFGG